MVRVQPGRLNRNLGHESEFFVAKHGLVIVGGGRLVIVCGGWCRKKERYRQTTGHLIIVLSQRNTHQKCLLL